MLKRSLMVFLIVAFPTFGFAQGHEVHQPKLTPQTSGTMQLLIAVSSVNSRLWSGQQELAVRMSSPLTAERPGKPL